MAARGRQSFAARHGYRQSSGTTLDVLRNRVRFFFFFCSRQRHLLFADGHPVRK